MIQRQFNRRMLLGTGLVGAVATTSLAGMAAAQESTPPAHHAGPPSGFPVAIHEGRCDDLTPEPAYEIGDALSPAVLGEDVDTVGQQARSVLLKTSATIDATIEDLASREHVLAVHHSADQYGTIVACGRIAGVVDAGRLEIAVPPAGDVATAGVAVFDADGSGALALGEGQLQVTVYVFEFDLSEA